MGYYSTVALTIYKNDYLRMIVEAKAHRESSVPFITKQADVYGDKDGDGKSPVTLYWSYVKWSNRYDEVEFVTNFIKGIPHSLKRVGECCDDIESECYFDDDDDMTLDEVTQIQTEIYVNGSHMSNDGFDLSPNVDTTDASLSFEDIFSDTEGG